MASQKRGHLHLDKWQFYAFYRSLDAYRASFRNRSDLLVLDPSSEFFKYLKNPGGPRTAPAGK